jgi:hypothetical protein
MGYVDVLNDQSLQSMIAEQTYAATPEVNVALAVRDPNTERPGVPPLLALPVGKAKRKRFMVYSYIFPLIPPFLLFSFRFSVGVGR